VRTAGGCVSEDNDRADPASGRFDRGDVAALCTAVGLALSCFSGLWQYLGSPVGLDRPVIVVGLLISFFRLDGTRRTIRLGSTHVILGLAVVWTLLSALWAGTLTQPAGLYALLDRFGVFPFLLFMAAPVVFDTPKRRRIIARTLTILGLYLALVAFAEALDLDGFVWPRYIVDSTVSIHIDRARGPYVEAVANGLMLVFTAAIAGAGAVLDANRKWRIGSGLVALTCLISSVFTLTRAVWLGAAVALVAALVAVQPLRRWFVPVVLGGGAAVVLLFALVPGLAENASERAEDNLPVWDRLNSNAAAVRMVEANPLFGVGWQRSVEEAQLYTRLGDDYPVTGARIEIHNVALSRVAELGLPGGILWLATIAAGPGKALLRRGIDREFDVWRAALLVIAVTFGVVAMLGPLPYPQPNYVLWCVSGLLLGTQLTRQPVAGRHRF
jgi:putative inorganic carbon (HCO3(-)) transporter